MKTIDISLSIHPSMPVWPGDPHIDLHQVSTIANGDTSNVSQLTMSVHTGTHIDAPKHFIDSGLTVDQIPLEQLIGEVLVLEIDYDVDIISDHILQSHPNKALLEAATKVLFKTRNSNLWAEKPTVFDKNYVGIDTSGARYLQQLNLDLIGIDYLSIAPFNETSSPHQILLSGGSVLLEGLNLSAVTGGVYELFCLPMNITGCEGAPARVMLIDRLG